MSKQSGSPVVHLCLDLSGLLRQQGQARVVLQHSRKGVLGTLERFHFHCHRQEQNTSGYFVCLSLSYEYFYAERDRKQAARQQAIRDHLVQIVQWMSQKRDHLPPIDSATVCYPFEVGACSCFENVCLRCTLAIGQEPQQERIVGTVLHQELAAARTAVAAQDNVMVWFFQRQVSQYVANSRCTRTKSCVRTTERNVTANAFGSCKRTDPIQACKTRRKDTRQ